MTSSSCGSRPTQSGRRTSRSVTPSVTGIGPLVRPTVRKATKPSNGSKRRRLADKKHRSGVKSSRRGGVED